MHQRESLANLTNEQKHASNNIGVVLFAFGKPHYYGAAYNLAFSIKRFNSGLKIALYVDDRSKCYGYAHGLADFVDSINEIKPEHLSTNGKLDPGKLKVNLYEYLPFDHNIYLDVDAVALKDIEPMVNELINAGKDYISHTVGYHTIQQGRAIPSMQWAWADDIWQHFELSDTAVLPAINSSIQYIRKGIEAEKIYIIAKDYYENNQLPVQKLRMKWGGGQPDELYMNVALAKLGLDPAIISVGQTDGSENGYIHFAMQRRLTFEQITERFYLQSYYGGQGFTPLFYVEWLDRLLRKWFAEAGKQHIHFINRITSNKYAGNKK
jgi:hypothetical protein